MNKREVVSNFIFYALGLLVGSLLILAFGTSAHAGNRLPKKWDVTETFHKATHTDFNEDEPTVSILQGSDRNTSLIVVTWPDGQVDKLLYKNTDADRSEVYGKWFDDRIKDYESRKGSRVRKAGL